mmetsp:Transcript_8489/g.30175  ORF Transcript_8489/g.30175 Transcript_8489/m.30175 type:complete len:244 (-) Transcript_8489:979-1710(-)
MRDLALVLLARSPVVDTIRSAACRAGAPRRAAAAGILELLCVELAHVLQLLLQVGHARRQARVVCSQIAAGAVLRNARPCVCKLRLERLLARLVLRTDLLVLLPQRARALFEVGLAFLCRGLQRRDLRLQLLGALLDLRLRARSADKVADAIGVAGLQRLLSLAKLLLQRRDAPHVGGSARNRLGAGGTTIAGRVGEAFFESCHLVLQVAHARLILRDALLVLGVPAKAAMQRRGLGLMISSE